MSRNIIDTWAKKKLKQSFEYGNNDCRWIIAEFLQIQAQWEMPAEIKALRDTYKTPLGAARVEKKMKKSVAEYIMDAGYEITSAKKAKTGDIIMIEEENEVIFLPVIYSQVVLVGDPKTNKITQANVYQLNKDYSILRKGEAECHP